MIIPLAIAAWIATVFVATAWPVWTWSLTLAAFGLPHVLVELRWVDERFGGRIGSRTLLTVGCLLLAVVGVRCAAIAELANPDALATTELALVVALAVSVVPMLARSGRLAIVLGVTLVVALTVGVTRAPIDTLIVLAFLHNLTPVGFLAERLRGTARHRVMLACIVAFGAVPILIASGIPAAGLTALGVGSVDTSWLAAGTLAANRGVFVPSFVGAGAAADLFRCAAYLQCLHYAVVIHVLPRLGPGDVPTSRIAWPERRPFAIAVALLGAVFLVGFAFAFRDARVVYGVFAAVHAWVEIPILLLAVAFAAGSITSRWRPTHSPSA